MFSVCCDPGTSWQVTVFTEYTLQCQAPSRNVSSLSGPSVQSPHGAQCPSDQASSCAMLCEDAGHSLPGPLAGS